MATLNKQRNAIHAQKQSHRTLAPILLLILINIVIGLATVRSYGENWDEPSELAYGRYSIQNYFNLFEGKPVVDYNREHLDQKGPAFFILADLSASMVAKFAPEIKDITVWHFLYFLSFQVAILALYFLVRRWVKDWAALGTALLFSTQPLLWGHAFINQKDIAFMALFLASVTVGLYAMDTRLSGAPGEEQLLPYLKNLRLNARADWQSVPAAARRALTIATIAASILIVLLISGKSYLNDLVGQFIQSAYADTTGISGRIFRIFAQSANRLPAQHYIEGAQSVFAGLWIVLICLIVLAVFWQWIARLASLKAEAESFFSEFVSVFVSPALIGGAVLLGLTNSIRILGPVVALIIAIYALGRCFRRALPVLTAYVLIGIAVTILAWPYLWVSPVERYLSVLKLMSHYVWNQPVLFNGVFYSPNHLPWYYLPELFVIQLTEPLLLLALTGLLVVILRRGDYRKTELAGLGIWFVLPVISPILAGSTLYDNFRQFLFVLPPLFILAGLSMEQLFDKVNGPWFKALILLIVVLPGIYAMVNLHPYEYTYYNSLAGAGGSTFRRFENDYWGTSFAEAADFLNHTAPANARILVAGPDDVLRNYVRPDLKVIPMKDTLEPGGSYEYLVVLTRWNQDQLYCPQSKTIFTVERENVVFTVIRQLSKGQPGCQ